MSNNTKTTSNFFVLNSDVDMVTAKLKKLAKFKIIYKIIANTEAKSKGYTEIQAEAPQYVYFETGQRIFGFAFCERSPRGIAIVTAGNKYLFKYNH